MADPYLTSINATLTSLGYSTKVATEPNARNWDTLPLCLIVPEPRKIEWIGFGRLNTRSFIDVESKYLIVFVSEQNLDTTVNPAINQFKTTLIQYYMTDTNVSGVAGTWNCRVEDDVEFDTSLLPEGYNYTAMRIIPSRIFQGVE